MQNRAINIIKILKKEYPNPMVALNYSNPMQLLVAVILSAQCTDVRVNIVTKNLFKKYVSSRDFALADPLTLEREIYSTGFYKSKSKNIISAAKLIEKDFNGIVPDNMNDLLKLAGVARKTANVILSTIYNKNLGVCIDTHCIRLSNLWGITSHKDPVKIEQDIMKLIPNKDWDNFSLLTIAHGRKICIARRPKCPECVLNKICPSARI